MRVYYTSDQGEISGPLLVASFLLWVIVPSQADYASRYSVPGRHPQLASYATAFQIDEESSHSVPHSCSCLQTPPPPPEPQPWSLCHCSLSCNLIFLSWKSHQLLPWLPAPPPPSLPQEQNRRTKALGLLPHGFMEHHVPLREDAPDGGCEAICGVHSIHSPHREQHNSPLLLCAWMPLGGSGVSLGGNMSLLPPSHLLPSSSIPPARHKNCSC